MKKTVLIIGLALLAATLVAPVASADDRRTRAEKGYINAQSATSPLVCNNGPLPSIGGVCWNLEDDWSNVGFYVADRTQDYLRYTEQLLDAELGTDTRETIDGGRVSAYYQFLEGDGDIAKSGVLCDGRGEIHVPSSAVQLQVIPEGPLFGTILTAQTPIDGANCVEQVYEGGHRGAVHLWANVPHP